jgi:hypothetical protein
MLLDIGDDPIDAPARSFPDLSCCPRAVAPHQLMQFKLAVRREKARAASSRTATNEVPLDEYYAQTLAQKLGRSAYAAEASADDQHVAC